MISAPVRSALPVPATLDSLLTLPKHQKYQLLVKLLKYNKSQALHQQLDFVKELTDFFIKKGNRDDVLLLQVACFSDTSNHNAKPEQVLRWGFSIAAEARALQDSFAMALIHQRIGSYFYIRLDDHANALRQLWIVNRLIKELGPERYPDYNYDIYYLARSYYDFFDYKNAIRQGEPLTKVLPENITATHIYNTCLLGMSYYYLKKPAEARKHFLWGLQYVPKVFKHSPVKKDIGWAGIFYGNMGLTYFQEKNYKRAISYLMKGFDLTTETRYWNNVPLFGAKLARIYLENNQLAEAQKYAMLSIEAAHRMDTLVYPVCRYIAEPYEVMSDYYRKANQPANALAYTDSAKRAYSKWKKVFDVGQKHQAEIAIAREEFLANEIRIKKERERQDLSYKILIIIALLISSSSIILYLRHLLRAKSKQQMLAEHKKFTQHELQEVQEQLVQIKKITQKHSDYTNLTELELALPESPNQLSIAEQSLYRQLQSINLLTYDDWTHFVQLFEKAYPGFFTRLSFRLPDLTPAEVRFLALTRLGCSNREMAAMLGVGPGAIRQHRLRLRRKLQLPDHIEIEEMVAII